MKLRQTRSLDVGESLWWWIVHEVDTFFDAAFQSGLASLEKFLFLIVYIREDIGGLLCSRRLKHSQHTA